MKCTMNFFPRGQNDRLVLFDGGWSGRLQDHFANEIASAAAQEPRAARREARVLAPRVVARVPAVQSQRTPEAAHAVRLAILEETSYCDLVGTRVRKLHMCSPDKINKRMHSFIELSHKSFSAGSMPTI